MELKDREHSKIADRTSRQREKYMKSAHNAALSSMIAIPQHKIKTPP
jgi:hypothetical protein